jgi:hypothetical protein
LESGITTLAVFLLYLEILGNREETQIEPMRNEEKAKNRF